MAQWRLVSLLVESDRIWGRGGGGSGVDRMMSGMWENRKSCRNSWQGLPIEKFPKHVG